METQFENPCGKDLDSYWTEKFRRSLNEGCKNVMDNCASIEYAEAVILD